MAEAFEVPGDAVTGAHVLRPDVEARLPRPEWMSFGPDDPRWPSAPPADLASGLAGAANHDEPTALGEEAEARLEDEAGAVEEEAFEDEADASGETFADEADAGDPTFEDDAAAVDDPDAAVSPSHDPSQLMGDLMTQLRSSMGEVGDPSQFMGDLMAQVRSSMEAAGVDLPFDLPPMPDGMDDAAFATEMAELERQRLEAEQAYLVAKAEADRAEVEAAQAEREFAAYEAQAAKEMAALEAEMRTMQAELAAMGGDLDLEGVGSAPMPHGREVGGPVMARQPDGVSAPGRIAGFDGARYLIVWDDGTGPRWVDAEHVEG